jgi:hypothetical protein
MKKILLLSFVLLSAATINAQFGINAGANLANLGGSDATAANLGADKKVIFRPHFGVYYNAAIGDNFSIQPEVGFSPQGVKLESTGITGKIVLNYINIGALARWNSTSGFYLGTGPQFGILQSAEAQIDGEPDEDIKDQLKSSDFAWMFRAGYDLPGGFGFYGGFNLGLGTIDDETPAQDIKNRVIQIGIRYNLTKGKMKEKE